MEFINILKGGSDKFPIVILAGKVLVSASAKELVILSAAYVAGKCLNRKKVN